MVKLALLGEAYPSQMEENPTALRDVQVVWSGSSVEAFREEVPKLRPDVLALDFLELNAVDTGLVPGLLEMSGAKHAIVTYRFARRGLLQQYPVGKVRLMQGPISLSLLRAHVHLAVLDDMLQPKAMPSPAVAPVAKPEPARTAESPLDRELLTRVEVPTVPRAPRYTQEQLGRLLEIASVVQCECPNHLSQLVSSLQAFEEYSKRCENRNDEDRVVHGLLYRYTAAARTVMEAALAELVKHEKIAL
jgi:hypothetical protein